MATQSVLAQLKELYDAAERTRGRSLHMHEWMPLHVHPQSLNYGKDRDRKEGAYNRLVREARDKGLLTDADLAGAGLPLRLEHKQEEGPMSD